MEFPTNDDKWNYIVENALMSNFFRYNDFLGYCISNDEKHFLPVRRSSKDEVSIFLFHKGQRSFVSFTDFKELEEFLETETNLILLDGL